MASFSSYLGYIDYWSIASNQMYGTLSGEVNRSDNTISLTNMTLSITSSQQSWGTSPGWTFRVNGTPTTVTLNAPPTSISLNNTSFTVSPTATSAQVSWSVDDGQSGSFTVDFPSGSTPPEGLSLSNLVSGLESFTATVSITGWGQNPGEESSRYRELQVWTYSASGLVEPRRFQADFGASLSSSITVDNTSLGSTPSLTIAPNTRYVIGIYANNGNVSTGSQRQSDAYTLPPTPTSAISGTQSYNTFSRINVPFTVSYPADGGGLPKTIQYRTIKGAETSEWQTFATVSGGNAGSVTQTIILDSSSTYTVEFRASTSAGISPSTISTQVTTLQTHEAPIFSDFDYRDTNPDTTAVTENNQYLIAGLSTLQIEVPIAKKATPSDPDYPVIKYIFSYEGTNLEEEYSDTQTVGVLFGASSQAGQRAISVSAVDSLNASTAVIKNVIVLPYSAPTLSMTISRISESGESELSIAGSYSPLTIEGVNKNTLTAVYRLSDESGTIIDWSPIVLSFDGNEYSGSVSDLQTDYDKTYLIEVQVTDAFNEVTDSQSISGYQRENLLDTPQYSLEVWTRTGDFVADISKYLTADLNISWKLNDIEEVSFSVSLDAMELLRQNGSSIIQLLTPYAHDIKVRRNGEYIVGCQVVEANIRIDASQIPVLQVKATGYLNIFKDQYISEPLAGYTYPEMAHKLINRAQHADCLIKNPTGDIDASYWISPVSSVAQTSVAYAGAGAIQTSLSTTGWRGLGTQMFIKAGTPIKVDLWVSGQPTDLYIRERQLINNSSTQGTILSTTLSSGDYTHLTATYTTLFDNGYLYIEQNQTVNTPLRVDNVFVSRQDDEDSLNNQYIGCIYVGSDDTTGGTGHNWADTGYISNREYNYELQNVKDAIMDLVNMGDDHFDFSFTPDRVFNTYERKGTERTDIEVLYPGNVYSMTVDRSAADMANKIQEIGSGIGDERLEVLAFDNNSRLLYGTRESVVTANNVSLENTLQALAQGELDERGQISQTITVTIQDGSINCGNIQTGDVLAVKTGSYLGVLGQQQNPEVQVPMTLLGGVEGWYKVKQINAQVSREGIESITLHLDFESSFIEES